MTEVKTIDGEVLFSFDEGKTTLAKEIGNHENLAGVDLSDADLDGANFANADLRGAYFLGASLRGVNFYNANLMGAYLEGANLKGANLWGANLAHADLKGANFRWANLAHADLKGADITGAYLFAASNVPDMPLACPEKGSFIAWKKVEDDYLVKLEIPADAKRSSATTKKCRCDKALVLDIVNIWNGEHPKGVVNYNYCECVYEVGKMVYPDWFDENRWRECSHGIHFFMDRKDAIEY